MMLKPLYEFLCDTCGEIIRSPDEGFLQWYSTKTGDRFVKHQFVIVHHFTVSPLRLNGERYVAGKTNGCYLSEEVQNCMLGDSKLIKYLGPDGLDRLLSMLDDNLKDRGELIEVIRRLHMPHYEEARLYWGDAYEDGVFDGKADYYTQDALLEILGRYGDLPPETRNRR